MQKRHRIFVAINLPGDIKKALFEYSKKWPNLPAKWTNKDNLHITLEFLGSLTDEDIGGVCVAVKEVAERNESFSLSLNQILYGPPQKNHSQPSQSLVSDKDNELVIPEDSLTEDEETKEKSWRPKMVWAEGEKSKELADLRNDLEETIMEKVAFVPENQAFAPHITLARINAWGWKGIEPEERPEIDEKINLVFTVESIEVMESIGSKGGPRYTVLESHTLCD